MADTAPEATDRNAGAANPESPVRVGLIGCGRLGTGFYMPAIRRARGVELAAIAEPDLGRSLGARKIAWSEHGEAVRVCPSAKVMLESRLPDAVIVAGPPDTHLEHATMAAAAGVPAMVEKPPALDAAEAAALAALDPAPRIGFNRRFSAGTTLRGALGDEIPAAVELELRYLRARWRPHVPSSDALADAGCHLVDLALMTLLGGAEKPVPIRARAIALEPQRAQAELRVGDRSARLSCAVNRPWRERAIARNGRGQVTATWSVGGPLAGVRARLARSADPLTGSLTAQLEAFAAAVRGGDPGPLAGAGEGLRAMQALDAVRNSALAGGEWVEVPAAAARHGAAAGGAAASSAASAR